MVRLGVEPLWVGVDKSQLGGVRRGRALRRRGSWGLRCRDRRAGRGGVGCVGVVIVIVAGDIGVVIIGIVGWLAAVFETWRVDDGDRLIEVDMSVVVVELAEVCDLR